MLDQLLGSYPKHELFDEKVPVRLLRNEGAPNDGAEDEGEKVERLDGYLAKTSLGRKVLESRKSGNK